MDCRQRRVQARDPIRVAGRRCAGCLPRRYGAGRHAGRLWSALHIAAASFARSDAQARSGERHAARLRARRSSAFGRHTFAVAVVVRSALRRRADRRHYTVSTGAGFRSARRTGRTANPRKDCPHYELRIAELFHYISSKREARTERGSHWTAFSAILPYRRACIFRPFRSLWNRGNQSLFCRRFHSIHHISPKVWPVPQCDTGEVQLEFVRVIDIFLYQIMA